MKRAQNIAPKSVNITTAAPARCKQAHRHHQDPLILGLLPWHTSCLKEGDPYYLRSRVDYWHFEQFEKEGEI